jgi:hypothetical protein
MQKFNVDERKNLRRHPEDGARNEEKEPDALYLWIRG